MIEIGLDEMLTNALQLSPLILLVRHRDRPPHADGEKGQDGVTGVVGAPGSTGSGLRSPVVVGRVIFKPLAL